MAIGDGPVNLYCPDPGGYMELYEDGDYVHVTDWKELDERRQQLEARIAKAEEICRKWQNFGNSTARAIANEIQEALRAPKTTDEH